jgi:hypothetical protein
MTIDYKKYDYTKIGNYTNLMVAIPKERRETAPVHMCPFMEPLISKLALTHPEWTIVGLDPMWTRDVLQVKRFTIYEGNDVVGRINRDGWHEEDFKYEILNDRVRQVRERSGGMRTKDMKKALKAIDQFFFTTTDEERRFKAVSEMGSHINSVTWGTHRALTDVFLLLMPAMANYIVSNIDELRPALEERGVGASTLDKLAAKLEPYNSMAEISAARANKTGTIVTIVKDRYMLMHDSDPTTHAIVTSQQMDPAMAGKIAILKVYDNDEDPLDGVGMRLNAHTFYVLP